jgi:V8-like Glu-specific endopeptidase
MVCLIGRRQLLRGIAAALLGSFAMMATAEVDRTPRIIRPPDDRVDYFATSPMLQAIGDSVCAQIGTDMLTDHGDGTFTINAGTLATDFSPLCAGEPFADQPTAAHCTATLIAPDILITAGHCLDEDGVRTDLSTLYYVFDYAVKQAGVHPTMFTDDQVYRAVEILDLASVDPTANDWAVLRLDRAVEGRTPVAVRSSGSIAVGQAVVAIGFGAGLPMKFSGNATVQALVDFGFEADFDIIGGNSGGPIINANTGMIEGVLSADQGIDDFFQDGPCFRATVCPQDPDCDDSFTLLASVMIQEFQVAIQAALAGVNNGGMVDGDADNDGVPDDEDLCPNTPSGAEVDEDGCAFDDDFIGGRICGSVGMIPLMFMTLGLALMRRR